MRISRSLALLWVTFAVGFAVTGCTSRKEIWVYTSLPKEVIAEMADPLQTAVPQAEVKWYQSGSENVEGRLGSEMELGKIKADLVLMSDPLWFLEMKQKGRLLAYDSPAAKAVPINLRDPDNAFVTVRLPVLVLGYNAAILKPADLPEKWKDLASPRFNQKVSMASPLDSTSAFVGLGVLSKEYGWEFFEDLRKRGLVAEGTQSSVLSRLETGERPLGMISLETVIRAGREKGLVKAIYPQDGVIPVPSPIAIFRETEHPELAQKVYDWFFSTEAQVTIVRGGAYSPLPKFISPEGAKPWGELQDHLMKWSPQGLAEMLSGRDRIRAKFSEVVLH